jgi:hypothetical protein
MVARKMAVVMIAALAIYPLSAADEEKSVLSRVMTVDDPGLAECLRAALGSTPPAEQGDAKRLETVRVVTESYAQIKLFDALIAEIDKRLRESHVPDGLTHELVGARADLEMKRTTELAKLRVAMHIVPRYPLGQWPVDQLNGWLVLDVIDPNCVCVFTQEKPFQDMPSLRNARFTEQKSGEQVEVMLSQWIGRKDMMPLRIDVLRAPGGDREGVRLYEISQGLARKAGVEMRVDLRLRAAVRARSERQLFVVGGKIGMSQAIAGSASGDTGPRVHMLRDVMAPAEQEAWLRDTLRLRPGEFPMDWTIEYHLASQELAAQTARQVQEIARQNGVESLVRITLEQTKSPWPVDLGRP